MAKRGETRTRNGALRGYIAALRVRLDRQAGQSLIQIALVLTVLLAFLAIAIDVGNVYQVRRKMQNAADAGALAGAWQICFGAPANASSAAWDYAVTRNGADGAQVAQPNAWTVAVVATQTTRLFLAQILGMSTLVVGARAEAACGAAGSACGLWPIAFREDRWLELSGRGCGTPFFVFSAESPNDDADCTIYDCDVDDDGIIDILGVDSRTWVDFSEITDPLYPDSCTQTGCGASELECHVVNDAGVRIELPACFAGDNGARASVKDGVESRIGDAINVPIYDYTGCPGRACPGGNTYHVSSFACVTVNGWHHNYELPRLDGANPPWKGKVIEVAVHCGECATNCGSTPSGGEPPPWAVRAVSLTQ